MKILGREPALWLQLISGTVMLFSAFVVHLTIDQQSAINAVAVAAVGVATALVVRDGQSAAVLGFIKAALALSLGFGLAISAEQQSIIMTFAAAVTGMWLRTQVTAPVTETVEER